MMHAIQPTLNFLRQALSPLRAAASVLIARWWAFGGIVVLTAILAAVILAGLASFAGPIREAQLHLLVGDLDASATALLTVLMQLGLPGLVLVGLSAAAGAGAVVALAADRLVAGEPRRSQVARAIGRGLRRAPISAATALIAGTTVAALIIGVGAVMLVGVIALLCFPFLRRAERNTNSKFGRVASAVTLRRAVLLVIPFGAPIALALRWLLAFPIAVLEPVGPLGALRQSAVLMRNRQTSVVIAVFAAHLVSIAAQFGVGALVGLADATTAVIAQAAMQVLIAPLALIVSVVIVREGLPEADAAHGTPGTSAARRRAGVAAALSLVMIVTMLVVPPPGKAMADELKTPTILTVSTSPNPSAPGQPVELTVTAKQAAGSSEGISGSAIVRITGSDSPVEMAIRAGSGSRTISNFPDGTTTFTVEYSGNSEFAGSTTNSSHTVAAASSLQQTAAVVSASAEPSRYGTEQVFTAHVTAPDGSPLVGELGPLPQTSAQFIVNGTAFDVGISADGTAALALDPLEWLGVGTHTIGFSYPGNGIFAAAAASLDHVVVTTGTTLVSEVVPATPRIDERYALAITVTPARADLPAPSGTVTIVMHGDTDVSHDVELESGAGTLNLTAPATAAELAYTVSYPGDLYYDGSTMTGTVTVAARYPTTTRLSVDSLTPSVGDTVQLTAEVQSEPGSPLTEGTVQFRVHRAGIGPDYTAPVELSNGSAELDYTLAGVGTAVVTAEYLASVDHDGSTSDELELEVGTATPTVVLNQQSPASERGETVEFTVDVQGTPGLTPRGDVTFSTPGLSKVVTLNASGKARWSTDELPVGVSTITASYAGNASYRDGSATVDHEVAYGSSTLTLTASGGSLVWGQNVTLTAKVASASGNGPTPSGSVIFSWPGASESVVVGADGRAQLTVATLPVGVTTVTARYDASSYYLESSDHRDVTIAKAATATALSASTGTSVVGQPVTYTATVSIVGAGAGTPSGAVTFGVTGADAVTVPVGADGIATAVITTTLATAIAQPVSAQYSGDANFADSRGQINQAMQKAKADLSVSVSAPSAALGDTVDLTVRATTLAPSLSVPGGTLRLLRNGSLVREVPASGSGTTVVSIPVEWLGETGISVDLTSTTHTAPTSNTVTITGTAFTPGLTLTTDAASARTGDPVTLRARLEVPSGFSLSGTIAFYDGTLRLSSRPITRAGVAIAVQIETHTVSSLAPGEHQLRAVFTSDVPRSTNASSSDTALSIGELGSVTQILSPSQVQVGSTITWLIGVSSPEWASGKPQRDPRGRVDLYLDGVKAGSGTVADSSGGRAFINIVTPALTEGTYAAEARFVPSSAHSASVATAELAVFSSKTTMTLTHGTPEVEWGKGFSVSASVQTASSGTWPAPSGFVTVRYEDDSVACTIPASGGPCTAVWSTPGSKNLSFDYPGDAVHAAVSETRTITVNRRASVLNSAVSATTIATADPLGISWQLLGPDAATVTVGYPSVPTACTSTTLSEQCTVTFPLSRAGATVPIAVGFAGDALWKPVSATHMVTVIGCYPLTLTMSPAEAGTLTALRAADCNGGTGYLAGSRVTVSAEPKAQPAPEFNWTFTRFQPGATAGTPKPDGAQLEIVIGPREANQLGAGPTNWVRAEFEKTYNCVSVELITETFGGATGSLTAPTPNCPIDVDGKPVTAPRWSTTVQQTGELTTTTRIGRVLVGTVVPAGTTNVGAETDVYGYSTERTGALTLKSVPGIRAVNPIQVARVRFGPLCHGLDLQAVGPGQIIPITASNCRNPLAATSGWTADSVVDLIGIPSDTQSATATPHYITGWSGAAAATGTPGNRINVRVDDGTYRYFGPNGQRNTVKILNDERTGGATQSVGATFASCVKLTVTAKPLFPAKGTVQSHTPGNCPGFEDRNNVFTAGTTVAVTATEQDWVRKAQLLNPPGEDIVRDSYVTSYFGEWSDGSTDARHEFVITSDTVLSASFWFVDQASRVRSCAEISLKSAYPDRLKVGLKTNFDTVSGCPRGNLGGEPAASKLGTYTTTLNPDRLGLSPAASLTLIGTDTAADSSALVGWKYDLNNSPGYSVRGYHPEDTLVIEGTTQGVYAMATLCEKIDLRVALTNDRGETLIQPVPEDSKLVMVSPAPNCPFDQDAWTVGTNVQVGAFGDPTGYAFTGWTDRPAEAGTIVPVTLDGIGRKQITAGYTVTCFTLTLTHDKKDVTRYPEPNCPGHDPAESRYAGSTMVSLSGAVPKGKVWQGWVGDVTGKINPAILIMDADKSAGHRWRSKNVDEKVGDAFDVVGDAFVSIGDEVAIIGKKMLGGMVLALVELAKWMPPMGIINAVTLVASQTADLLAVLGVPKGSVEWLKAGQKIMDFAYSGLSCATVWAMNGNGNEKDNLFAKPEGSSSGGGLVDTAVAVKDGALGVKGAYTTAGFVNATRSGYLATKMFAINNAVGGLGFGSVALGSVGTMANIVMSGGFGIDASAKDAWTDGDAYTNCLASKIPNF